MTLHPRTTRAVATASAAVLALGLSACGSDSGDDASGADAAEETVTVTDSQDREVEVPLEPEVVVATDWSAIRTLSDLGVEVDAVPAPNAALPEDIARYESSDVPKVGDVFEPDYEAIAAMEPDLVVVGSRSGTPEVVAEFERFAPAVLDMSVRTEDPAEVVEETTERVEALGRVFGVEDRAEELMTDVTEQMDEVRSQIEDDPTTAMFVQVSEGTVSAYGPDSRFGQIFADFGYEPTDAPVDGEGSHGEEVSQEFFAEYDPGALFVLDRAKAIGSEESPALDVLDNDLVGGTPAAQDDRIQEVDGFSWYLATSAPSSLQQMIEDVRASL